MSFERYSKGSSGVFQSATPPSNKEQIWIDISSGTAVLKQWDTVHNVWAVIGAGGSGNGDMLKSVYDTNNDGIIDHSALADTATNANHASNSDQFGGELPSYYATEATVSQQATDIGNNASNITQLQTDVGTMASLNTTATDSLVHAINEVNTKAINAGDMKKSVYDPNGTGIVTRANNADNLGGQPASHYAAQSDVTTNTTDIGTMTTLKTTAKSDLVSAVNEIHDQITGGTFGTGDMMKSVYDTNNDGIVDHSANSDNLGGQPPNYYALASDLNNESANVSALSSKVDTFDSRITNNANSISTLQTNQGDLTKLTTTNKSDLVSAINEVKGFQASGDMMKAAYDTNNNGIVDDSEKLGGQLPSYYATQTEVGTISNLTTTAKSDLVSAVNEVNSKSPSDATTTAKGIVQLAGDLTGTATSPQLANTAVTAGTYNFATITVDSKGRITSASSGSAGTGDMNKSTYDTDNNGIVDNSDKLGGQLPSYYAKASDVTTNTTDIGTMANLATTAKTDLVSAINEVNSKAPSDATTTAKGIVQLAGDLSGTATSPALSTTGVTAGTYTLSTITVDAKGRITSASNGNTSGLGDMMKSTYDTDNNGIVDNADKLGGQLPTYYAKQSDLNTTNANVQTNANSITTNSGNITTLQTNQGDLTKLTTTAKTSLVNSINEVNGKLPAGGAGDMLKSTYDTNNDGIVDHAANSDNLGGNAATYYAKASDVSTNTTSIGTVANLTTTAKTNLVSAVNEVNARSVQTGTAFPATPADGQPFYRTDLEQFYTYNTTAVAWVQH